jgi:hypothetical protein
MQQKCKGLTKMAAIAPNALIKHAQIVRLSTARLSAWGSYGTALPEKLTVAQPVYEFPDIYRNRTLHRLMFRATCIRFTSSCFLKIGFNINLTTTRFGAIRSCQHYTCSFSHLAPFTHQVPRTAITVTPSSDPRLRRDPNNASNATRRKI